MRRFIGSGMMRFWGSGRRDGGEVGLGEEGSWLGGRDAGLWGEC
jgi:hypothetical protein